MYSEQTKLLGLPQWQPKDHPDFLTDMNEAYRKIDSQFQGLDGLSAKAVADMNERLTTAEAQMDVIKVEVQSNTELVAELQTKVTTLSGEVEKLDQEVETFALQTDILDKKIDAEVEARTKADEQIHIEIEANEARIDSLESTAEDYGNKITKLQEDVAAIEGGSTPDIDDLKQRISTIESEQTTQNNSIDDLKASMQAVEQEQSEQGGEIETLKGSVAEVQSNVNNINDKVTTLEEASEELDSIKQSVEENTQKLNTELPAVQQSISSIETEQQTQNQRIEALENAGGGSGYDGWEAVPLKLTIGFSAMSATSSTVFQAAELTIQSYIVEDVDTIITPEYEYFMPDITHISTYDSSIVFIAGDSIGIYPKATDSKLKFQFSTKPKAIPLKSGNYLASGQKIRTAIYRRRV